VSPTVKCSGKGSVGTCVAVSLGPFFPQLGSAYKGF